MKGKVLSLQPGESALTIDSRALTFNFEWYISQLPKDTHTILVLKDRAYGSGLSEVAHHFESEQRVAYYGVARTFEGVLLRNAGVNKPIIVLNPTERGFEDLLKYDLEPEIYSLYLLENLAKYLEGRPLPIHLKIDTGMHRLGILPEDLQTAIDILLAHPNISVATSLTHLSASGSATHFDFTKQQIDNFSKQCQVLSKELGYSFKKHCANSAAITKHAPYAHLDLVRLGIGLYGLGEEHKNLRNVCALHSAVADIKWIEKGETASYNRSFTANRKTRLGMLFIGYSDGIRRKLGNGSWSVCINGQQAPIVGDICMDICIIDLTDVTAEIGDTAIFFQSAEEIQCMSEILDTIPYEILTILDQGIPRKYIIGSLEN